MQVDNEGLSEMTSWLAERAAVAIACAAVCVLGTTTAAQTQDATASTGATLMVVFDGSGSMWGKLSEAAGVKFQFVRAQLIDVLAREGGSPAAGNGIKLGITTFGELASGGCAGAKVVLSPGRHRRKTIEQALGRFNPKGRGPVGLGLQTAAAALETGTGANRILLIHDSLDNCDVDVCAIAQSLKRARPALVIDTLFLAPKPSERGGMACVGNITGGTVTETSDGGAVVAALQRSIAAARDTAPAKPAVQKAPAPTSGHANSATAPLDAEPGLLLSARLAGSNAKVERGVAWRIEPVDGERASDNRQAAALTVTGGNARVDLTPGKYRVSLLSETLSRSVIVDVGAKSRTPLGITLNVGLLEVTARREGLVDARAIVTLRKVGADAPDTFWIGTYARASALLLEPGDYSVSLRDGHVASSQIVRMRSGKVEKLAPDLAVGEIVLSRREAQGRDAAVNATAESDQHFEFQVAIDDSQAPNGRRIIARSSANPARFRVPPNTYHLILKRGSTATTDVVVLGSGQRLERKLTLKDATVRLRAQLSGQPQYTGTSIRYRIWRSDKNTPPIILTGRAQPSVRLTPGSYRIESRIGRQNAVAARNVTIVEDTGAETVQMDHDAGVVQLRFSGLKRAFNTIYWEVKNAKGHVVWRTFTRQPELILQTGIYTARATVNDQTFAVDVAVRPGQVHAVTVGAK